jgi:aryl-alcohol dehydrogenase-like predicted oxidoreductase
MDRHPLGNSGLDVTRIGYGAFKIGRNEGTKYPDSYDLPTEEAAATLLGQLLELGIGLIDTAPAYGLSEERIGAAISDRYDDFTLSTKVGETFQQGKSSYDFSPTSVRASVMQSLERLRTSHVDLLLVHSDGRDEEIQADAHLLDTLADMKSNGSVRAIGFSGKTIEGMRRALEWSDVLMLEYHLEDQSMEDVIRAAADRGVGVLIKKGLGSGHLDAEAAIGFLLQDSPVCDAIGSIVIGSLSQERMATNIRTACALARG